jgi:hypothetical protein
MNGKPKQLNWMYTVLFVGMMCMICSCDGQTSKGVSSKDAVETGIECGHYVRTNRPLPLNPINLQKLVNDAPDSTQLSPPYGRYILSTPLVISGKEDTVFAFVPGTQIHIADTDSNVIDIVNCRNITVSGVRARHQNPLSEYECHGAVVSIRNSTNVHIDGSELNGCGAVGIIAATSKIKVTNCHIHSNTFSAVYLDSCSASFIANIIEDNANGIQAYDCSEILWSDNLVRNNGGYWSEASEPGVK